MDTGWDEFTRNLLSTHIAGVQLASARLFVVLWPESESQSLPGGAHMSTVVLPAGRLSPEAQSAIELLSALAGVWSSVGAVGADLELAYLRGARVHPEPPPLGAIRGRAPVSVASP
jgi:hypothetical protein